MSLCRQSTKSRELRAAMSLAQLWQQQGRRGAACKMLEEISGWFTKGFDTVDLPRAGTRLAELV